MTITRRHWLALSVFGLALAASLSGLHNGFAYDDQAIIAGNPNVQSLAGLLHRFVEPYWPTDRGSGLYRPLTIILFSLQWAVGGGAPLVFHLANILLYGALAVAVLTLVRQLLPESAAWLAAALFAVHPVHVEAVANGVGQAELTTALAVVVAVSLYLRARLDAPAIAVGAGTTAALVALYLAACLSKEHGVVLPVLLLAAEVTVVTDPRPWRERARGLGPLYCTLAVAGIGFLLLRGEVLRDVPADTKAISLLALSTAQRVMTVSALVPQWLRLLVLPAHLQADYSPQETAVVTSFDAAVLLGAGLLIGVVALAWLRRERWPVVALGTAWVIIALLPVSNLLVASGQVLAERTMMLPSVGAVLIVAGLAAALVTARSIRPVAIATAAVIVAAGVLSAARQPVWQSDESLIVQTAADAPRSYWAQWMYGDWLFTHGQPAEGERRMRLAVQLYPDNPFILRILAGRYQDNGFCQAADPLYRRTLALRPGWWEARLRWASCLEALGQPAEADRIVDAGIAVGAGDSALRAFRQHSAPVPLSPATATPP